MSSLLHLTDVRNLLVWLSVVSSNIHQSIENTFEHANRVVRMVEVAKDEACLMTIDAELLDSLDIAVDDGDVAFEQLLVGEVVHGVDIDVGTASDGPVAPDKTRRVTLSVSSTRLAKDTPRCGASMWPKADSVDGAT